MQIKLSILINLIISNKVMSIRKKETSNRQLLRETNGIQPINEWVEWRRE
jgi:hypothetical protein